MTVPPAPGGWRLVVDGTRCDGHGICVLRCPDLLTLDEWGFAGVEPRVIRTRGLLRRARRAEAGCPEGALDLRPVGEPGTSDGRRGPPAGPQAANREHN